MTESVFQTEMTPGGIQVRFSHAMERGKFVHSKSEDALYMAEDDRYWLYFCAFGLEKGFEECQSYALRIIHEKIDSYE